jgi:hypothetical protein
MIEYVIFTSLPQDVHSFERFIDTNFRIKVNDTSLQIYFGSEINSQGKLADEEKNAIQS